MGGWLVGSIAAVQAQTAQSESATRLPDAIIASAPGSATAQAQAPAQAQAQAQAQAADDDERPAFPAISDAPDAEARLPDDDSLPTDADSIVRTPRFRQLAHELRCLVCQNQTLLDSNAPLAQDLRNEVIRLIASGRDDGQIKQYLVERYGEFVLYRPSWSWRNALLWFGPALMLLTAGLVGWRLTGGRRRSPPDAAHRTAAVRRNDGAGRDTTGASAGTDASASSVSATAPTLHPVDGEDGKDDRDVLRDAETTRISSADEALKRVDALLAEEHDPPPAAEHR